MAEQNLMIQNIEKQSVGFQLNLSLILIISFNFINQQFIIMKTHPRRKITKRLARKVKIAHTIKTKKNIKIKKTPPKTIRQTNRIKKKNEQIDQVLEQLQDSEEDQDFDLQQAQIDLFQADKMPKLDIPPQIIGMLEKSKRDFLKKQFPGMPEYFFLDSKQKVQYFKKIYDKYLKSLNKDKKIFKHNHNKKVKFTPTIEVKKFKIKESPEAIVTAETYKEKHSVLSTRMY